MSIKLGATTVSMMNPPNEGEVIDNNNTIWKIGRNSQGMIVLRQSGNCHPDFLGGLSMRDFCEWINSKLK